MLPKYMVKTLPFYLAVVLLVGIALRVPPARLADTNTHTVCAAGCDFTTIQAALDDDRVVAGAVIQVIDAVHTEAGVTVRKDVTIRGQGAAETIVQAHATPEKAPNRVFLVEEGVTATLEDMTIRHGRLNVAARSGPKPVYQREECGGGILNFGALTLDNCVVTSNLAGGGGGICNTASLTITNCTVSDNIADGIAPPGLECGNGGGIKSGGKTLTIINSTISGNQAQAGRTRSRARGGGVHVGCTCTAVFTNSTISGNQAIHEGGGVAVWGTLRLVNCTISHNTASGLGGGIYIRGPLDFENTIIANNDGRRGDCFFATGDRGGRGSIGTNSHNLLGDGSCDTAYSGDPLLGPLADNGGVVQTHALLPGSPAIDVVPASDCPLTTDQRGLPRPVACTSPDTPGDLGAFEVQADECVMPTPSPRPTEEPPTPTTTPARATSTPEAPAPSDNLLWGLGLLGLLVLILVGLAVIWLRRRGV